MFFPHPMPIPAPNPDPDMKTRQLAYARELQAMGMGIARIVAARATAQPETAPAPTEPTPAPEPAAPRDPVLAFARVARVVQNAIILETRVANDDLCRRRPTFAPIVSDTRRAKLRRALHDAVQDDPDRARRRRAIDERLDAELRADPTQQFKSFEILETIANEFQIPINLRKLPDEVLGFVYQPPDWARPPSPGPTFDPHDPDPNRRANL